MEEENIKHLPREIVLEIISRLPISSVVQLSNEFQIHGNKTLASNPHFAQLCKNHHTTASRSCFFLAYDPRNHASDNNSSAAFLVEYASKQNKTPKETETLALTTRLNMEFLRPQERPLLSFTIVNSCNGWLLVRALLHNRDSQHQQPLESLRVVNPVTQCCFILDKNITSASVVPKEYGLGLGLGFREEYGLGLGLGFSAMTGKYKVVRFIPNYHRDALLCNVEVLTLEGRSSEWRRLDHCKITLRKHELVSGLPVVWNGGLHWLLEAPNQILRFDLDKEELEFLTTPYSHDGVLRSNMYMCRMGVLRESWLYMGVYNKSFYLSEVCMEIWVMKEYGRANESPWTRLTFMYGIRPLPRSEQIRVLEDDHGGKILALIDGCATLLGRCYPDSIKWDEGIDDGIESKVRKNMKFVVYEPSFLTLKDLGC